MQFSLIIGFYLAAMGIGAFLSRYIKDLEVLTGFITIEILLGVIGAFSVPLCYYFFAMSDNTGYQFFVLSLVTIIGTLTGFEIPLLTRILQNKDSFNDRVSDVLTFDYLGALGATLLFPFVLLPFLGLYRSSLSFGIINLVVAFITMRIFRSELSQKKRWATLVNILNAAVILLIVFMLWKTDEYMSRWKESIYKYPIIHSENSQYQKIDLARNQGEFRLYLDGAIQFSSRDEYRYHEGLVHVPLSQVNQVNRVLLLGGGEGLALREILKYPELDSVDLVDIDPAVTNLARTNDLIVRQNESALDDPKVNIYHEDAFRFLKENDKKYDAIIVDLPDPTNESLARLYSDVFYQLCLGNLATDGVLATQATSPHLSTNAFWCIDKTLHHSGFTITHPYQVYIPSFGAWGFILAKKDDASVRTLREDVSYRYLDNQFYPTLFHFSKDVRSRNVDVNQLDRPILLEYYLDHWNSLQAEKR